MEQQIKDKQIIEAAKYLLNLLDERQKEVLTRRFGLEKGKKETLESIGENFNITRERVRQIEKKAIERIKNQTKDSLFQKITEKIREFLNSQGGFKKEDKISEVLGLKEGFPYLLFILYLDDDFFRYREDDLFYNFWATDKSKINELKKLLKLSITELEKINQPLEEKEFFVAFPVKISDLVGLKIPQEIYRNCFEIFKPIEYGLDKKIGLIHWPEIKPRGLRDKAYITLKNAESPLHFREIAKMIEELDHSKKVHTQSLHNELIKDERFVLVGRGFYGLRERGFKDGVLKEIIISILKDSSKPLSKDEILEEVARHRLVKPNTIISALYDKTVFQKTPEGFYYLR
jgi:DNA-directed RNA polymerase delta subunit